MVGLTDYGRAGWSGDDETNACAMGKLSLIQVRKLPSQISQFNQARHFPRKLDFLERREREREREERRERERERRERAESGERGERGESEREGGGML
ncbi:hypothetical protein DPMN_086291 [Dreissena polymorpha]|uniref:Uncharacterized protein n=1 Tax=Dreissena polymorpha TaxID=45954 RepID=A0A9D4KQ57_DREPO|nr:hypothetical protein DPMN_086291 [Dreissena polymorpha]